MQRKGRGKVHRNQRLGQHTKIINEDEHVHFIPTQRLCACGHMKGVPATRAVEGDGSGWRALPTPLTATVCNDKGRANANHHAVAAGKTSLNEASCWIETWHQAVGSADRDETGHGSGAAGARAKGGGSRQAWHKLHCLTPTPLLSRGGGWWAFSRAKSSTRYE